MGEKKNRKFKDHVSNKNSVCYVNKIRSYHLNHSRIRGSIKIYEEFAIAVIYSHKIKFKNCVDTI